MKSCVRDIVDDIDSTNDYDCDDFDVNAGVTSDED
jgi:hypothetical protein